MLNESDINNFTEEFYNNLFKTLEHSTNMGGFYFSLDVFIIGNNGDLKIAHLYPDADIRIINLELDNNYSLEPMKNHFENGAVVRCIYDHNPTDN